MFDPAKLGEEADSMIAALNQPQGDTPVVEDQPPASTEAIAQPPDVLASDKGVEAQPVQPDISAQLAELKKQAESADQRWRVLQGMIDKKDEEISSLRVLLAQLSSAKQEPTEQKPNQLITQADITEYGTDLIDLIGRKASEVVKASVASLESQLAEIRRELLGVAQTSVKSAEARFKDAMTSKVADWETLNTDPAFIEWLGKPAPFTKESRLNLLRKAATELDVETAAEFFVKYKEETTPPPAAAPAPDPARFVAPGKSKAPATRVDNANTGRVWTRADIAKLYDDKMAGKLSQKEFDELERDVFKAQRENRIAA
jgi:hypothetical protein